MTPFNFHWWIQVLPFDWWKDEEKYLLLAKMTHFCLHMTYCWKLTTFPIKLVGLFQMSDWFSNGISEILKIIFKISFLNKENCRDSRTIMIFVFRNQICKTCEYKISRTLGWRMIDPNWFENFEMQLSLIEIKIQKLFFLVFSFPTRTWTPHQNASKGTCQNICGSFTLKPFL